MARNKVVHLGDIEVNNYSRSKYIINKADFIGRKYNKLFLKDIVCNMTGHVFGVCDCECGETDILTGINKLITMQTKSCSKCARAAGSGFNSTYDSDKYIGQIYGHLQVLEYYYGEDDNGKGVFWRTKCTLCGNIKDFKASSLVKGTTTSCGCLLNKRNNKYSDKSWEGKDISGTIVLKVLDKDPDGQYWICKCKYCNKPFKVQARKIVSRHTNSCGCMTESLGVIEISKYLSNNNIDYIREWSHKSLLSQYGNKLRYDFAILNKANKVIAFIEYDGNQHTDPNAGFGKYTDRLSNFADIVDSDNRKNEFAKINNIPLLRINYNRKSQEIIDELRSFINKLNII